MGRNVLRNPENYFSRDEAILFDEFWDYTKDTLWTDIQTDATATVTIADGQYSKVKLLNIEDDESSILHTVYESFKFVANKALYAETSIEFTDSTNNAAALMFGFADAFALDLIADGGQSLTINDSAAAIFKKSEGTVWCFHTEIGGTAVTSTSTTTATGTAAQLLAIDIIPFSSTLFQARPFVDGKQLLDSTSGDPICHNITLGTATDMQLGFELKGGETLSSDVEVDYVYAAMAR